MSKMHKQDKRNKMSKSIVIYAIRHNPTGNYLPMGPRQNGRGGTLREPEEPTAGNLPRIFPKYTSALTALRWWVAGKCKPEYDEDYGHSWEKVIPVPSRKFEDMEIVPITLELP